MKITCDNCKCNLFETILPMQFDDSDFRVWSYNSKLVAEVIVVPIVKCIKCGTIKIPPTSMMGKSILDPEVKAYAQLIEDVKIYNQSIKDIKKIDIVVKATFDDMYDSTNGVFNRVRNLENKVCACSSKPIIKEEKVVKTAKRSGKNSKPTV